MDLIAEIGWNHMGDMRLLEAMTKAAAEAGATHAKFQTWTESRLKPGPWDTDGRREIYNKAQLSYSQFEEVRSICENAGIRFLTSLFDHRDAEAMARISDREIKIPSTEVANRALLEAVGEGFQQVYLSTGACTAAEVDEALEILRRADIDIVLLHCVSVYPCIDDIVNLPRLRHLQAKHPRVGLSDHTPDILSSLFAIAMGAEAIEKHFTIDNSLPGRDNRFEAVPTVVEGS